MQCFRTLLPTLLLLLLGLAHADPEAAAPRTERWYEIHRNQQKLGHSRVVWAPSTWEGRKTVHDTTTITERTQRNMAGMLDVFEVIITIDLERSEDGTLWWMRTRMEEAGRTTSDVLRWTGQGYEHRSKLGDVERVRTLLLDRPVKTDAESFLGARIRAGTLKVGQKMPMRILDLRARIARDMEIEVLGREVVEDASTKDGKANAWKVRERDPLSGASSTLWLDEQGAFVRLATDGGDLYRRVAREQAQTRPAKPAEARITTPSSPTLERVMNADALELRIQVQGDASRKAPTFPDSPWSRTLSVEGDDAKGWVHHLALRRYDDPKADTPLPIDPKAFERELEATVLMPAKHPLLQEAAKAIVGEETSAHKAAWKLARWIFDTLEKESPEVGQASALEILESGTGDCSEHALLFVALCRAAGIPARRCSGYVCIGETWGAHAWAEIWVGRWIGADPTTGEVGTAARYVFFGYPEQPGSHPGVVSSRASGRIRFVATKIVEGDQTWSLEDPESWQIHDRRNDRFLHVLAGIETRGVPRDWTVRMMGSNSCFIRASGLRVGIRAMADQGFRIDFAGGPNAEFAGQPARAMRRFGRREMVIVHSRRRLIQIDIDIDGEQRDELRETLEKVLAPTFAPRPLPWETKKKGTTR